MYRSRLAEARSGIVVRLQCMARVFLSRQRIKAWKELVHRKQINQYYAALSIQLLARRYNAVNRVAKLRYYKKRREAMERRAATIIQVWYRETMEAYFKKLDGKSLQSVMRQTWQKTMLLQRLYRGYRAREKTKKLWINLASHHKAAIMIQRIFR
jgi:chorismate mutase